jgi:hypothetical protein
VLPAVGLISRADDAQPQIGEGDVQRLERPWPLRPGLEPQRAVAHRGVARVERSHHERPVRPQQPRARGEKRKALLTVHRLDHERSVNPLEALRERAKVDARVGAEDLVPARRRFFHHLRVAVDSKPARDAALAQEIEEDAGSATDVEDACTPREDVRVSATPCAPAGFVVGCSVKDRKALMPGRSRR